MLVGMSATLIRSFVALVPSSVLFFGSIILFSKTKSVGSVLQLLGAGCLIVVILTHIAVRKKSESRRFAASGAKALADFARLTRR